MSDLDDALAAIDHQSLGPDDPDVVDAILVLMEAAIDQPGGLVALAARYGDRDSAALLRPLSFLLARTMSRDASPRGTAIAMDLVDRVSCRDEMARSNLLAALHLAAMYRLLPTADSPLPRLAAFLVDCLHGSALLVDAAVPATACVLAAGVRFSDIERQQLRAALDALRATDPEWVAAALAELSTDGG